MQIKPIETQIQQYNSPREEFDSWVIGALVTKITLSQIRSFIAMFERECFAKREISMKDALDIVHFRTYENSVADILIEPYIQTHFIRYLNTYEIASAKEILRDRFKDVFPCYN